MLKQATVGEVRDDQVAKADGHLVVVTRYYPRFLRRVLVDEYISELAPSRELLYEFKSLASIRGHNEAFERMSYQRKFNLSPWGFKELYRLAKMSRTNDVYLICYCSRNQYCHREMLLIVAREFYGAATDEPLHSYGTFVERTRQIKPKKVRA